TIGNLGSLLPSALLAYYIYRYRYLELVIEESLIVATFAAVVLTIYLYGIRVIGEWVHSRFGIRTGVVEAVLILGLTLAAAPLRKWLEQRFHRLFERQATLYREIVDRIGAHAGRYRELPELLHFVEDRSAQSLGLRSVRVIVRSDDSSDGADAWVDRIIQFSREQEWSPVEDLPELSKHGYRLRFRCCERTERLDCCLLMGQAAASLL